MNDNNSHVIAKLCSIPKVNSEIARKLVGGEKRAQLIELLEENPQRQPIETLDELKEILKQIEKVRLDDPLITQLLTSSNLEALAQLNFRLSHDLKEKIQSDVQNPSSWFLDSQPSSIAMNLKEAGIFSFFMESFRRHTSKESSNWGLATLEKKIKLLDAELNVDMGNLDAIIEISEGAINRIVGNQYPGIINSFDVPLDIESLPKEAQDLLIREILAQPEGANAKETLSRFSLQQDYRFGAASIKLEPVGGGIVIVTCPLTWSLGWTQIIPLPTTRPNWEWKEDPYVKENPWVVDWNSEPGVVDWRMIEWLTGLNFDSTGVRARLSPTDAFARHFKNPVYVTAEVRGKLASQFAIVMHQTYLTLHGEITIPAGLKAVTPYAAHTLAAALDLGAANFSCSSNESAMLALYPYIMEKPLTEEFQEAKAHDHYVTPVVSVTASKTPSSEFSATGSVRIIFADAQHNTSGILLGQDLQPSEGSNLPYSSKTELGNINAVPNLLGQKDYVQILNERSIIASVRDKWDRGVFPKVMPLPDLPLEVIEDSTTQKWTLKHHYDLLTLETIALYPPNANVVEVFDLKTQKTSKVVIPYAHLYLAGKTQWKLDTITRDSDGKEMEVSQADLMAKLGWQSDIHPWYVPISDKMAEEPGPGFSAWDIGLRMNVLEPLMSSFCEMFGLRSKNKEVIINGSFKSLETTGALSAFYF